MKPTTELIIKQYQDSLFSLAFSICKNAADADDVVQDTFIKYHTKDIDFETPEHVKAWLIRVCVNRSKDVVTSFWRRNKESLEDYMSSLEFEEPGDSELFQAVIGLPEKYRVVIHLYYYEEYSTKEIADILKSSEGTIKSRLSRGRMFLKKQLQEEWEDE